MTTTQQQILDTAGQLFASRGYELVGINEIIEKSGVAKATFYSAFRSKEKLCAEWMRSEAASSKAAAQELLAQPSSPAVKVARRFDDLKKHVKNTDFRGCPFSITASMTEAASEVREVIRDYKAAARSFWQALAGQTGAPPAAARLIGDTLFLLYSGAITEAQNARNTWPVESARAAALALIEKAPA